MKIFNKLVKIILKIFMAILILDIALVLFIANFRRPINKADAIIVLGAAINSPALFNRSLEGLSLYREGKGDILILAGGRVSPNDISEAGYMKKVIEKNSTQPIPLLLDETSTNTLENIQNAKKLLPEAKSVIVVSDEYHLARGVLLAARFGYWPVYWSAPEPGYYSPMVLTWYYLREVIAMIAYVPVFLQGR